MKRRFHLIALGVAAASALTLVDLRQHTSGILLWAPKLLFSTTASLLAALGALLGVLGLRRRDPWLAGAGLAGAALASRHVANVTATHRGFEQAFGPNWPAQIPPQRRPVLLSRRWTPYLARPTAQVTRRSALRRPSRDGQAAAGRSLAAAGRRRQQWAGVDLCAWRRLADGPKEHGCRLDVQPAGQPGPSGDGY
ncbi:MAG: hypothetical protein V9H69_16155 [Anaerolineae bacterium]